MEKSVSVLHIGWKKARGGGPNSRLLQPMYSAEKGQADFTTGTNSFNVFGIAENWAKFDQFWQFQVLTILQWHELQWQLDGMEVESAWDLLDETKVQKQNSRTTY